MEPITPAGFWGHAVLVSDGPGSWGWLYLINYQIAVQSGKRHLELGSGIVVSGVKDFGEGRGVEEVSEGFLLSLEEVEVGFAAASVDVV